MNGKGDKRRPLQVPKEQFNDNWDAIFKKKKEQDIKKLRNVKDETRGKI